jgi:hypothetical protein
MLVVIGMWAFRFITQNFPVFEEEHEHLPEEEETVPAGTREMILSD